MRKATTERQVTAYKKKAKDKKPKRKWIQLTMDPLWRNGLGEEARLNG